MMDVKTLRYGNWFNIKTPMSSETYHEQFTNFSDYLHFEMYSSPIPFTTEWAQRFGLIGKIINGLCISESEYQGHEYDLCLYDEHTWDSERRVICPIYHVHQCQNIFLDLAGHIIE